MALLLKRSNKLQKQLKIHSKKVQKMMYKKRIYLSLIITLFFSVPLFAQIDSLRKYISNTIAFKKADIGICIAGIEDSDTLSFNGNRHYPMQSVFKFHIALAVLHAVDNGKFALNQKIPIKKSDLLPDTWSPLREAYPEGGNVTLAEIIRYTVSQSDNNGSDILLRLIGGTKKTTDYCRKIGINDVSIQANEAEMHKEWNIQFSNWTTPNAAALLLKMFYERKILSETSQAFLWKAMLETSTGKKRIKAQLPENTPVAHKTGTSGINKQGITGAINDMGIVTLPDGRHFIIAVFVVNSSENENTNEKIIADVSKLVWDFFVKKNR